MAASDCAQRLELQQVIWPLCMRGINEWGRECNKSPSTSYMDVITLLLYFNDTAVFSTSMLSRFLNIKNQIARFSDTEAVSGGLMELTPSLIHMCMSGAPGASRRRHGDPCPKKVHLGRSAGSC